MKYKLVLFDLDGTLVNTLEAISKVINLTLEEMNIPPHSLEENRKMIGHGINGIADKIYENEQFNKNTFSYEKILEIIKKHYKIYFNYKVELYENIDKLLDFLTRNNILFGIVTNKEHNLALETVKENLGKWNFIEIIGENEKIYPKKPNPYNVNIIIDKYKINKKEVLFVGDMIVDVETAKNANIDIAYCNWGFGAEKKEKGIAENIKVKNIEELINLIKG